MLNMVLMEGKDLFCYWNFHKSYQQCPPANCAHCGWPNCFFYQFVSCCYVNVNAELYCAKRGWQVKNYLMCSIKIKSFTGTFQILSGTTTGRGVRQVLLCSGFFQGLGLGHCFFWDSWQPKFAFQPSAHFFSIIPITFNGSTGESSFFRRQITCSFRRNITFFVLLFSAMNLGCCCSSKLIDLSFAGLLRIFSQHPPDLVSSS